MNRQLNFGIRIGHSRDLDRARAWGEANRVALYHLEAAALALRALAPHGRDYPLEEEYRADRVRWNEACEAVEGAAAYCREFSAIDARIDLALGLLEASCRLGLESSACDPLNDPSSTLEGGAL